MSVNKDTIAVIRSVDTDTTTVRSADTVYSVRKVCKLGSFSE